MAGAMEMASRNHEIVSENLVHATTPGYRRQGLIFEATAASTMPASGDDSATAPPPPAHNMSSYLYLEPGPLQQTNNPLDVAIHGDAFFVLQGPNGPLYTRNGSFERGPGGELQTRGGGYRVSSQGGGLSIPADAGNITMEPDGTISVNGAQVGRLQLASFASSSSLRRVGPTLFEGDGPRTPAPTVTVEQGYREGSNVQPVQEMVSMMLGMRFYEAAGKAMQALSDAIAQNTRPQANGA